MNLGYAYCALRYGERRATVSLDQVDLPAAGAHAAVWLGASTPDATAWLQAGVEQVFGEPAPSAYVEVGAGGTRANLWRWPLALGETVLVRLRHTAAGWSCKVGAHPWRGPVVFAEGQRIRTLETYAGAGAVATLDGKRVRASSDPRPAND